MAAPLQNYQDSLALHELVPLQGIYPSRDPGGGGSYMTMGMIRTFAGSFTPAAAPAALGQELSISQNTALFSLFGTTYGGNGTTTFALPDLRARTPIGDGKGAGLAIDHGQGVKTGVGVVALTQDNLPASFDGSSKAIINLQPSLPLNFIIQTVGNFPTEGGGGGINFIGQITKFAGTFIPSGHLECDGRLLNIAEYETLFYIIGTTYGGDGVTTFALPDLRGRNMVGAGTESEGNTLLLGETTGRERNIIVDGNMPQNMGGGGAPLDNEGPGLAVNYLIALQGVFPSPDGGTTESEPMLAEIVTFAGNFAPRGWALCQGQLLPINQNQALFSLLGTTFGGDGRVNFALPDLRGRTTIGTGPATPVGTLLGSDALALLSSNMPDLTIAGTGGADQLFGGDGDDDLRGGAGNDTLTGLLGDDTLVGSTGADVLNGGGGFDTASYATAAAGLRAQLNNPAMNTGDAAGDTYISIEGLTGSSWADFLVGNEFGNIIRGGGGADRIMGMNGSDVLHGGADGDEIDGGGGYDYASYENASAGVRAQLDAPGDNTGEAAGDTYAGIEGLIGSAFDDVLRGNALANHLLGGVGGDILAGLDGADTLEGEAGDDTLSGGNDNDILIGGAGGDVLNGGAGIDIASYANAPTGVNAQLNNSAGNTGHAAGDTYVSVEGMIGSSGNDRLVGNAAANDLRAGAGNDVLVGLEGADVYSGGAGNDRFVIANPAHSAPGVGNRDQITDWEDFGDDDTIDLSGFAGVLTFIGAAAFSAANQVRAVQVSANVVVQINTVGVGIAEAEIFLANTSIAQVDAGDFIL